ncbi:MAG: hypothetical protein ACPHFO_06075 [Acidimicrobiales bacterium]
MSKKSQRVLVPIAAVFALSLSLLAPAGAQGNGNGNGNGGGNGGGNEGSTCPGEHLYPQGNDPIIIEAPEGEVILSYCVKAGSAKNENCGPIEVTFISDWPTTLDITNACEGKKVSHYSFETGTPTPNTTTTVAGPTTTVAGPTTTVTDSTTSIAPEPEPEPEEDPTGVLGAGAANAQVGAPSFTG